jgi:hypothetical protein
MYAGEKLSFRMRATDPVSQSVIADAAGQASFYAPGRTADRGSLPDHALVLEFDPVTRYYSGIISTSGWAPGKWRARGYLSGGSRGYEAWEYTTFSLDPE